MENTTPATRETDTRPTSGYGLQAATAIVVVLTLVLLAVLKGREQQKKAARTEAMSNLRSVFYLMVEFDQDYGAFPGDGTAVDALSPCRGEYSNDYFRQLLVGGYTGSEEVFHAERAGARRPDNMAPWLGPGECGFALVTGLDCRSPLAAPLAVSPTVPGTLGFDPGPFGGYAVGLRVDGSAKAWKIGADGKAVAGGGKTLFEGGAGSVWGTAGFDPARLKHPE